MAPYLGNALFKPSAGHCFLLSAFRFPLSALRSPDPGPGPGPDPEPEPVSVSVAVPVPVPVSRWGSGSKWLRVCWPACLFVCLPVSQPGSQARVVVAVIVTLVTLVFFPSTGTRQGEERFERGRCKMGWLDRWMWPSLRVCERLRGAVRVRCGKETKADEMQVGT